MLIRPFGPELAENGEQVRNQRDQGEGLQSEGHRRELHHAERGILDLTHKRLFTRRSLVRALEDCGYRIDRVVPGAVPFAAAVGGSPGRRLEQSEIRWLATRYEGEAPAPRSERVASVSRRTT